MNRTSLLLGGLGLLGACGWPESDGECIDRAEAAIISNQNAVLDATPAKMVCQDEMDRSTWVDDQEGCLSVLREGTKHQVWIDIGGQDSINPDDYRLVANYFCVGESGGQATSGSEPEDVYSGGGIRVMSSTIDAAHCDDASFIEMDVYLANYEQPASACHRPVGAWYVESDPDGSIFLIEYDAFGGEAHQYISE